jgi:hypothetical protein
MRADMAKVIVERPRHGSRDSNKRKGAKRRWGRTPPEEWPHRDRLPGHQIRSKSFNEHLGPLRRYLRKQVGRPWDKVFSEICANINRNSVVQDHVRDHVFDYVAVNVLLVDGVPCHNDGRQYGQPLRDGWGWTLFYVCPLTGLLRLVKGRRRWRPPRADVEQHRFIKVSDTLQCQDRGGAWHLVRVAALPGPDYRTSCHKRDALLNKEVAFITASEARQHYGAAVYAVESRRLLKQELKQWPIPLDG